MSNVVINPFVLEAAGGADPSITFTWDPENDESLPGGTTFTRASVKQEFDGTDLTELSSGTIPENSAAVGGGAQGFHPEPAATNNVSNSSDPEAGSWTVNNLTFTDNGTGGLSLQEYEWDVGTANGLHRLFQGSVQAETAYIIASEGTGDFITVRQGAAADDYAALSLDLGTVTEEGAGGSGRIVNLGSGFHRCEFTSDLAESSFTLIGTSNTGTPGNDTPSYTGANETYLVNHIQAEDTPFSTSPILTTGTPTTRVADVLDTGISVTTAFSVLLDVTLPQNIGTGETITLLGPDTTAEDVLRVDDSFNVVMDDGGTPTTIGTASAGARIKVAYGRDAGDRSASLDGATAVDGDAPGAGHEGENFELGSRAGINQSRCIHHLSTLFNIKKSDAELEALAA